MRHLNYSHLHYFWVVAREGSVARASEVLHLAPQTISGQLKQLEESVGEALFHRVGRGLVLSDAGHAVKQYADEIFSLGAELAQRVHSGQLDRSATLRVGIVDSIPKLVAHRILHPAVDGDEPVRLVCREGALEQLLGELAIHHLDLVLSDRQVPTGSNVRAFNHRLGESEVAFFAPARQRQRYARRFPASLDGAPILLPARTNALRRSLDDWFDRVGVRPLVVAEFDDSALLKAFGYGGAGVFPAPIAIEEEVARMYGARAVGVAEQVVETYYAISPERRLRQSQRGQVLQFNPFVGDEGGTGT